MVSASFCIYGALGIIAGIVAPGPGKALAAFVAED
jgi:hypothetical protein